MTYNALVYWKAEGDPEDVIQAKEALIKNHNGIPLANWPEKGEEVQAHECILFFNLTEKQNIDLKNYLDSLINLTEKNPSVKDLHDEFVFCNFSIDEFTCWPRKKKLIDSIFSLCSD